MASRYNVHSTIYGDYVRGVVKEIGGAGGGVYSIAGFAERLGLKPTHNLRKRLRTLEKEGLLQISYGLVGKCGTCLIYTIPNNMTQSSQNLDIPF